MSSALRTISQIESHVKFLRYLSGGEDAFIAISRGDMATFLGDESNEVIASSTGINTVVKSVSEPSAISQVPTAELVRDLGRRVTIVNPTSGAHRQVWIEVQRVSGPGSEGVEDDTSAPYEYGTFWIRTFIDDGSSGIQWARLG